MPEPRDTTGNDALDVCPNCDTPRVIGRHGSSDCIVALRAELAEANREIVRLGVVRDGLIGASDRLEAELERVTTEREAMQRWMERAISDGGIDHHFVDAYRTTSEQEASRCSCGKPERGRGPWHAPGRCAMYAGALDLPIKASEQDASDHAG